MELCRKNILMVIPNLNFGGAQRSFNNLANALIRNHNVVVCVFNTFEGVAYTFSPKIIDLQIPGGSSVLSKTLNFYKRFWAIRKLKLELKIDTTISYLEGANYINVLTKNNDRVVLSVRGSKYHDQNITGIEGFLRRKFLIPIMYKFAHYIVALNNGIKNELVRGFGIKHKMVGVIKNFYDVASIEDYAQLPIIEKYSQLLNQDYIIYAGRLAPEKGIKSIIDAFEILTKENRDIRLVIMGEGSMRDELIAHARSKFLTVYSESASSTKQIIAEKVIFLGFQNNPYNFIRHATILVIGSTAEGGPNVLLESMICGTLVVSTDCPYGPKEQLAPNLDVHELELAFEGDYGILLPMIKDKCYESDIKEWARTIEIQIEDCTKRKNIERKAKCRALEQTPEKILSNWERII